MQYPHCKNEGGDGESCVCCGVRFVAADARLQTEPLSSQQISDLDWAKLRAMKALTCGIISCTFFPIFASIIAIF